MHKHPLSRRAMMALMGGAGAAITTAGHADAPPVENAVVEGRVMYRERMMLPQGAQVQVQLADISLADAPATILASVTVTDATASPVPFTLEYDPALLRGGQSYALQARITHEGRLLFINDVHHAFQPGDTEVEIMVRRVAADTDQPNASIFGSWLAEDIAGGGVIDTAQTTLILAEDGAVSGRGGCNSYGGKATVEQDKISFGQLVSTQMACPEALMDQESKFFEALGHATAFRIDAEQQKLFLLDEAGETVVRFSAM